MEERIKKLESIVGTMVEMLNDLDNRVLLLTKVLAGRDTPTKVIPDTDIIAFMEKEGVPWEVAKQVLEEEAKDEGAK